MSASGPLAEARYAQVQSITQSVVSAVAGLWRDADPGRILTAMQGETGRRILAAVIAGQISAAQGAQAFVTGAMLAQGAGSGLLGTLNPGALAGIASDGRPLATLLFQPAITTATALQAGLPAETAALRGLAQLATIVSTQVADSARTATSVAMAADKMCVGYVRVVRAPACSRCIVLAGRAYTVSTGFQRHPRCDCGMEPMSYEQWKSRDVAKSPDDLYRSMSPEERLKRFGAAAVKAMDEGADMGQLVNARRGMATTTTGKAVTTEGTTKRGIGGKALDVGFDKTMATSRYQRSREARLMPEQILKQAEGNRDLQVALLRKHGYIT